MPLKAKGEPLKYIFDAIGISEWNKPLTRDGNHEIGVLNPHSKIICLIPYLYSIDIGCPPLYAELQRA